MEEDGRPRRDRTPAVNRQRKTDRKTTRRSFDVGSGNSNSGMNDMSFSSASAPFEHDPFALPMQTPKRKQPSPSNNNDTNNASRTDILSPPLHDVLDVSPIQPSYQDTPTSFAASRQPSTDTDDGTRVDGSFVFHVKSGPTLLQQQQEQGSDNKHDGDDDDEDDDDDDDDYTGEARRRKKKKNKPLYKEKTALERMEEAVVAQLQKPTNPREILQTEKKYDIQAVAPKGLTQELDHSLQILHQTFRDYSEHIGHRVPELTLFLNEVTSQLERERDLATENKMLQRALRKVVNQKKHIRRAIMDASEEYTQIDIGLRASKAERDRARAFVTSLEQANAFLSGLERLVTQ